MRKLIVFFFLFMVVQRTEAAVFTVVSNANAGAGTLREAITMANANGTTTTDYIYFNLLGNNASAVTIQLESELPILTSNMVLDATTQPISLLANPNIKISLTRIVSDYFNGFRMDNAQNIEVYGFSFNNFKADPLGAIDDKKGGIYLYNSANITIGAPNKPNCFNGNYAGVISPFVIPRFDIQNIKISANIFGLSEDGLTAIPNETGIDISFLKNSVIGGNLASEGNIVTSNLRTGIAMAGADGSITIANNIVGLDKSLTKAIASPLANGIYVNGGASIPSIYSNIVVAQAKGIFIDYVNGGFVLANNKIGTGITGTENFSNTLGIHVNFSNTKGMIGGTTLSDANLIAYNKTAILIENSYPISILKNSIYCNVEAITFRNQTQPQAKIGTITANEISGLFLPGAKVELFYTDDCNDCEGKVWFATVLADVSGVWKYNGAVNGKVTSLGTNADGATSNFSKPQIDDAAKQIAGVYCGQNTGSIKNINVYNASVFQWYDALGQLVGTAKDLENVGAGTYYLKAGQLGACDVKSASYTISSSGNGINDSAKKITDALCSASNGSIKNITIANNLSRVWYNSATGTIVANTDDLENVPAGSYYFKAGQGTCEITSITYLINNMVKTYTAKDVVIVPSSCGNKNGSITVASYQSEMPTNFSWTDEAGTVLSVTNNLIGLFPGTYTLTASNGGDCKNIAGIFKVQAADLPVIDLSQMKSFISCDGKSISVKGIEVHGNTNPYAYKWVDKNGIVVYKELMLQGVSPDKYQLFVSDKYTCTVSSEVIDFSALVQQPLKIPGAISLNGDGINDTWKIEGAENYPDAEFFLFNRNGNKVFYSKGYSKEFDGSYKGKQLSVGVYYYVIDLKTDCGRLSGSLTILK